MSTEAESYRLSKDGGSAGRMPWPGRALYTWRFEGSPPSFAWAAQEEIEAVERPGPGRQRR